MKTCRTALLATVLLMIAAPVLATSSRVESLGGGDDYFEDVNNVLRWYGSVASYGGTALFDLGEFYGYETRRRAATLLADLDRNGRWGTAGLFLFGENDDEVIRLAWGRRLGSVNVGLSWKLNWTTRGWYSDLIGSYGPFDASNQVFGAGLRWSANERTYLDVACDVTQTGREVETNQEVIEPYHYTTESYSWRARAFHGLTDATVIVPLLAYDRYLAVDTLPGHPMLWNRDRDMLEAGLGVNHLPDADTMLVGSFTFARTHDTGTYPRHALAEHSLSRTSWAYILRMGVERRLLTWLSLRAGARQTLVYLREESTASPGAETVSEESSSEDLDLSLGMALHFGPFDADFAFQETAPFNLGSALFQAPDYGASTWSKITLQYVF